MSYPLEARNKINRFLGYGNLKGRYWFVGMEEGTAGNDEVEAGIQVRLTFPADIIDLALAHDANHLNWPICEQTKYPSCWIFMAKLVRSLRGDQYWNDLSLAKAYICRQLGREASETFLTELLPLPKRSDGSWPLLYSNWYGSRKDYERQVLSDRKRRLNQLIRTHQPAYVVCYGKRHYDHYREIADVPQWEPLGYGGIELGKTGITTFVLMPFPGNGQLSQVTLEQLVLQLRNGG